MSMGLTGLFLSFIWHLSSETPHHLSGGAVFSLVMFSLGKLPLLIQGGPKVTDGIKNLITLLFLKIFPLFFQNI